MHLERQELAIADLDFVETLAELCGEGIPDKFFEIIEGFTEIGHGAAFTIERLYNIMRARLLYPERVSGAPDEALLPTFSLDEGDSARVMKLCTGMPDIVSGANIFDAPHKRRLLNRIAAIEYQVNQDKGLYDVNLAGFKDLGEAGGKFGTEFKPLTDRIREIVEIVRPKTREYDQLPAPEEIKKLPAPDEDRQDYHKNHGCAEARAAGPPR